MLFITPCTACPVKSPTVSRLPQQAITLDYDPLIQTSEFMHRPGVFLPAALAAKCSHAVPFPLFSMGGNGNAAPLRSVEPLPTRRRSTEPAGALQRLKHLAETLILDRQAVAELGSREHHAASQIVQHLLLETALLPIPMLRDDLQVGRVRIGRDER